LDEVSHENDHSYSRCSSCGKKALQQGSIRKPQFNSVESSRYNRYDIDMTTAVDIGVDKPTEQKTGLNK